MGKMTDALRKAQRLKEQKGGRLPAAPAVAEPMAGKPAPSVAPIPSTRLGTSEDYVAPAKPASRPAAHPVVEPPKSAPPPPPPPKPDWSAVALAKAEPIVAEEPSYTLVEDEPGEAVEHEIPAVELLAVVEERTPAVETVVEQPRKPAEHAPLVFETVEEDKPAPEPVAEPVAQPVVVRAPEPVAAPVEKPVIMKAPEPVAAPAAPPVAAKAPEPVVAAAPSAAKPASADAKAMADKPVVVPAPRRVLPEVEPTPKPSRVPYLSVHYGRDERMIDGFRRLKTRLNEEGPARVILVASSRAGEGKSTVALNLAASFANTFGERVVVVDANVSRPKFAEVLEIGPGAPGLGRAVRGRVSVGDAAVKTEVNGLWAVASGDVERGEGLLDSDGMRSVLADLRKRFTRVIVEIPAVEEFHEGLSLAAQADAVLVPVMRSRSRRKAVRRLVETLRDRGASRVRCVFIEA